MANLLHFLAYAYRKNAARPRRDVVFAFPPLRGRLIGLGSFSCRLDLVQEGIVLALSGFVFFLRISYDDSVQFCGNGVRRITKISYASNHCTKQQSCPFSQYYFSCRFPPDCRFMESCFYTSILTLLRGRFFRPFFTALNFFHRDPPLQTKSRLLVVA